MLRLGGVPVRRDVAFGSLKDHQRFIRNGKLLPMWIGACEMELDRPVRTLIFENRRHMAGVKTHRAIRNQRRERPPTHQGVDPRHIVNTKRIGPVHGVAVKLRRGVLSKVTLIAPASVRTLAGVSTVYLGTS